MLGNFCLKPCINFLMFSVAIFLVFFFLFSMKSCHLWFMIFFLRFFKTFFSLLNKITAYYIISDEMLWQKFEINLNTISRQFQLFLIVNTIWWRVLRTVDDLLQNDYNFILWNCREKKWIYKYLYIL